MIYLSPIKSRLSKNNFQKLQKRFHTLPTKSAKRTNQQAKPISRGRKVFSREAKVVSHA
jgi:cytochrome c553